MDEGVSSGACSSNWAWLEKEDSSAWARRIYILFSSRVFISVHNRSCVCVNEKGGVVNNELVTPYWACLYALIAIVFIIGFVFAIYRKLVNNYTSQLRASFLNNI